MMPRRLAGPLVALSLSACWAGGVPRAASAPAPVAGATHGDPAARDRDRRPGPSAPETSDAPVEPVAPVVRRDRTEVEFLRDMRLMVPVHGISPDQIPDTYWAKRDGGRLHHAVDIMAARGTPIVATTDGVVLRVGQNKTGGIVVYTTDSERRFVYYYAHLERVHERMREGLPIAQGDVLGYVGTTGNAPPNAPHLHFQVMRMPDDDHYWEGMPVDVRPYLVKKGRTR